MIDNIINKTIPSLLNPRNDKIVKNYFYMTNKNIDVNLIIYFINNEKIQIILRNMENENGWNEDLQIILHDINYHLNKKKIIINCGTSIYNYKKINYHLNENKKEQNIKISYQEEYDQLIPKTIIQTYVHNNYHNIMHYNAVQSFLEMNPEYKYVFFNNEDCIQFISENFDKDVLYAYNHLIPNAYKADLFRYCYIYIKGGCYFDNKYIPRKSLKNLIKENDKNVYCLDRFPNLMFNSVLISIPKAIYFKNIIDRIVNNVQNKFYGESSLHPTGPRLFYDYVKYENIKLKHMSREPSKEYKNCMIVSLTNQNDIYFNTFYKGYYYNKNHRNSFASDYQKCWNQKKIYL